MSSRGLKAVLLFLATLPVLFAFPAGAAEIDALRVDPILIKWREPDPEYINIRIRIRNDSVNDVKDLFDVRLLVRANKTSEFRRVKVWHEFGLKAHSALSHDYPNSLIMDPTFYTARFEVKVEVVDVNRRIISDAVSVFPEP